MAVEDMSMWLVGAVVAGLAMALACISWSVRRQRSRRRLWLQERPVMTVDDWISAYVSPGDLEREATLAVCEALAAALQCHPTQLRPDDRLGSGPLEPIGWFGVWEDDELDDFTERLLPQAIGRSPRDGEWETLRSIADVSRWAQRVQSEQRVGAGPTMGGRAP